MTVADKLKNHENMCVQTNNSINHDFVENCLHGVRQNCIMIVLSGPAGITGGTNGIINAPFLPSD